MSAISPSNAPAAAHGGEGAAAVPGGGAARPWLASAWMLGLVAGAALQLQQPALWTGAEYAALAALALVLGGCAHAVGRRIGLAPGRSADLPLQGLWRLPSSLRSLAAARGTAVALALAACMAGMFAVCGARALDTARHSLAPGLEGQDIRVTGVVAAMPQANEAGTRLRLEAMALQVKGSVNDWLASAQQRDVGPLGDAAGDFFGIDMGL